MIKVLNMTLNPDTKKAQASLFSDTKNEVTPQATIVGLPAGYTLDSGSSVMTAAAEVAFMQSTGEWNWV